MHVCECVRETGRETTENLYAVRHVAPQRQFICSPLTPELTNPFAGAGCACAHVRVCMCGGGGSGG